MRFGRVSTPVPGDPLPVADVLGDVAVEQEIEEVPRALAPVDPEILDEERGGDHARPVVHPALGPQLAHAASTSG